VRSKYINPFTDYGFKRLFGEEGNKNLLVVFLNDILPIKDKIIKIDFKKNEAQGDTATSRKAIYDIFCEDEKGSQFIVEMQNAKQTYFKDRAVFYSTFPIRDQAQKGEWDFRLEPVYCIALLGFNFDKEIGDSEIDELVENQSYYHRVQLKDQRNNVFYEKLNFIFVELPKFSKTEEELQTHLDKWLYFLKHLDSFKSIPEILNEPIFIEAFKSAEVANFTEEEYRVYEESLMILRDNVNVINTARTEGREEGREEEKEQSRLKDTERVLKLLIRKFKAVDKILEEKVRAANSEKLTLIIEEILDIEDLVDVERLLK